MVVDHHGTQVGLSDQPVVNGGHGRLHGILQIRRDRLLIHLASGVVASDRNLDLQIRDVILLIVADRLPLGQLNQRIGSADELPIVVVVGVVVPHAHDLGRQHSHLALGLEAADLFHQRLDLSGQAHDHIDSTTLLTFDLGIELPKLVLQVHDVATRVEEFFLQTIHLARLDASEVAVELFRSPQIRDLLLQLFDFDTTLLILGDQLFGQTLCLLLPGIFLALHFSLLHVDVSNRNGRNTRPIAPQGGGGHHDVKRLLQLHERVEEGHGVERPHEEEQPAAHGHQARVRRAVEGAQSLHREHGGDDEGDDDDDGEDEVDDVLHDVCPI